VDCEACYLQHTTLNAAKHKTPKDRNNWGRKAYCLSG